jgi:hypothetical protein
MTEMETCIVGILMKMTILNKKNALKNIKAFFYLKCKMLFYNV